MQRSIIVKALIVLALLALVLPVAGNEPAAAQGVSYVYFPSALPSPTDNDGRMLSLGGVPIHTLAGQTMSLVFMVPEGTDTFEIAFFDGDTGKDAGGALNPGGGHWDLGTSQLVFELYADPLNEGSEENPDLQLLATFYGNDPNVPAGDALWTASSPTMPDNDWWIATVHTSDEAKAPSGHFFYHMHIRLSDPSSSTVSNFKVRTTAGVATHYDDAWGFEAAVRQVNDVTTIYPAWDGVTAPPIGSDFWLTTPTTYDGSWSFFFDVPTPLDEFAIWNGDFDFGTGNLVGYPSQAAIEACADSNDPNTPGGSFVPPWAIGTAAVPESAKATGVPPDDNQYDVYRRSPCVTMQLTDSIGNVYVDHNPSGNMEWEAFTLSTDTGATVNDADFGPPESGVSADGVTFVTTDPLPAGLWRVDITGLDLGNLNFLKLPFNALGVCEDGDASCWNILRPFLLGDTVWNDANANGIQEDEEMGIGGVIVNLFDENGYLVASTTTDGSGHYEFEVEAGTYTVQVAPENFDMGGALYGFQQTYDPDDAYDNQHTDQVVDTNVWIYDFGYRPATSPGTGTPGYWKNHPEAWPVNEIAIGGITYTTAEAIDLMNAKSAKDKTLDMFRTLVSAKLNVAIGNEWSCIEDALSQADAWMATHPVGSGVTANTSDWQGIEWAYTMLDDYNNGLLCAPHRD